MTGLAGLALQERRLQLPDSFAHAEEFCVVKFGVASFGEAPLGLFDFCLQFFDGRFVTCVQFGRLVAREAAGHQFGALSGASAVPFLGVVGEATEGRCDFVARSELCEFGEARDQLGAGFNVTVGFGEGPGLGVGVALAAGGQQQRCGKDPERQ